MDRRAARAVALALFGIALLGPWGDGPGVRGVGDLRAREAIGWALFAGAMLLVPVACLGAVLSPSRAVTGAYRTLLGAVLTPFFGIFALLLFSSHPGFEIAKAWGVALYCAALLLALVIELFPRRATPLHDYGEVFQ